LFFRAIRIIRDNYLDELASGVSKKIQISTYMLEYLSGANSLFLWVKLVFGSSIGIQSITTL
jgi:hypothetical protein